MKDQKRHPTNPLAIFRDHTDHGKSRSWLRELAPTALTKLPDKVSKSDAKIYFTRLGAALIGLALHLLLVAVYWGFGVPSLALLNAATVLVFAIAVSLIRSGRHYGGVVLCLIEAAIHAPLMTIALGLEAGYLIFNFITAMAAGLVFPERDRRVRQICTIYMFVSSVAVAFYATWHDPVFKLEPWQLSVLFFSICASTYGAIVAFAFHFARVSEDSENRVERELRRSEQLLLNILPAQVAERLKRKPETIADTFASATVLFADIVGFTKLAAARSSAEVVELLNEIFSAFDRIAEQYGLEKIKTIGDAYMVAGGIPEPRSDHAEAVVRMALDMTTALRATRAAQEIGVEIRIGVHTGPVVAGVIGEKKFAYDLWGDTVNTASRMESHGAPGRIQISEATYALISDTFDCEFRGTVELKGKGPQKTWWIVREKTKSARTVA